MVKTWMAKGCGRLHSRFSLTATVYNPSGAWNGDKKTTFMNPSNHSRLDLKTPPYKSFVSLILSYAIEQFVSQVEKCLFAVTAVYRGSSAFRY